MSAERHTIDADVLQILALRSGVRERVLRVLDPANRVSGTVVGHIIPLLAWDAVAPEAMRALQRVADRRVGQLVDALVDPKRPVRVRQRIAGVLAASASPRAVDGLACGLDDPRSEVRSQCERSLAAVRARQ